MASDSGATRRDRVAWPVRLLVALGTVLLVLANLALWARFTLLDSDEFTEKTSSVLRQPEASQRIGEVLARQTLESGALQERLAAALPQDAGALPYLLEQPLSDALASTFARLLSLEATQDLLERAILQLHDSMVSLLEGRDALLLEDGALVIRLDGVIAQVSERLDLESRPAGDREPATVVLVEDARSLDFAGRVVRGVNDAGPLLLAIAVIVLAIAVVLAPDTQRGLTMAGYAIAAAGIVSLILWRLAGWGSSALLDEAPVARMIVDSLAANLRLQSLILVVGGVLIVILADARVRHWIASSASKVWSSVAEFGTGRAAVIGAVVLAVLLVLP